MKLWMYKNLKKIPPKEDFLLSNIEARTASDRIQYIFSFEFQFLVVCQIEKFFDPDHHLLHQVLRYIMIHYLTVNIMPIYYNKSTCICILSQLNFNIIVETISKGLKKYENQS